MLKGGFGFRLFLRNLMRMANSVKAGVLAVLPARWASSRLPGKMLADVAGKPLIVRTLEAVKACELVDRVLVATDHEGIARAVRSAGGEAVMTSSELPSGSDRVYAAVAGMDAEIVVNVQGDEPAIPASTIEATVRLLRVHSEFQVATAAVELSEPEYGDPAAVKVVVNLEGRALYFSRAPIPHLRDGGEWKRLARRHVGIYAYRPAALAAFCGWEPTPLEQAEKLEQLRLLEHDVPVGVVEVQSSPPGVDTENDLAKVRALFDRAQR